MIQACRDRRLEPVVTLHHFTNPIWFARQGGWASPRAVSSFCRYVGTVAQRLGGQIRWWVTLNEPTVVVYHGYLTGDWPPGRKGDWPRALWAARNLIRAHRAAYRLIHQGASQQKGEIPKVGFAHHMVYYTPCDPRSGQDQRAVRFRGWLANRRFLAACRGAMDYLGLNYYTRDFVHWQGWGPLSLMGRICSLEHHADVGPRNVLGWEIFPEGLRRLLLDLKALELPVLITENGVCGDEDEVRQRFIEGHLDEVAGAIGQGVQVAGYLHWSLLDNFEWAHGFGPRFGLIEVDYATQKRRVRPSAQRFRDLIGSWPKL